MASTRDALRRQRRRELDARRSKSRVRLGSCQQSWGQLKDSLGFSLHSELAHYLLDSYFSKECAKCAGSAKDDTGTVVTSSIESLHRLVLLVHSHGQQCPFPPTLQAGSAWENQASGTEGRPSRRERVKRRRGTKRLAPQAGVKESASSEEEISPCSQGKEKGEAAHVLESELCLCYVCEGSHLLSWTPMLSSSEEERGGSSGEGGDGKRGDTVAGSDKSRGRGRRRAQEPKKECVRKSARRAARPRTHAGARSVVTQEKVEQPEEELMDLTTSNPGESNSIGNDPTQMESETGSDTMPEESLQSLEDWQPLDNNREDDNSPDSDNDNHHIEIVTGENDVPSPHRGKQSADVSQIAGKKKRKAAAPKEFLPCEFEGCGKIFSSRWFLNHHMKYQHVHQRTFTCSHSNCGKSFNYKKHLKEHEKLHSNQRDFICEFCARAFRTSSHLLVHCRIHTGEKPLQCEVCGFTCRQKASLNWHMRKHNTESSYQFPCEVCGRRFEKRDNLISHRRRSHSAQASGPAAVADSPPSGHTHPPPTGTGSAPPTDRGLDTHTDPPQPSSDPTLTDPPQCSNDPTHTDPPQPSSDPTHTDPPQPSSDPTHTDPPQPSSDPTHTDPPQRSSDPTLTDGDTGDSTILQT